MKKLTAMFVGAVLCLAFLAGAAVAAERKKNGVKVEVKDLPAAVTQAVAAAYPKATITKAMKFEGKKRVSFLVFVEKADKKVTRRWMAETGAFLDGEKVAVSTLPAAVTEALLKEYPGSKVLWAVKHQGKKRVSYSVTVETAKKHKARRSISEAGLFLDGEKIAVADLPAAVKAAGEKLGKVVSALKHVGKKKTVYKLTILKDKKRLVRYFDEQGEPAKRRK